MSAEEISCELHGRRSGRGWIARCPVHDDRSPSLSITERGGKILLHCFSGCPQEAVIGALKNRGLWPEAQWTPAQRRDWAAERARDATALRHARWWGFAAHALAETVLENLDPWDLGRESMTRLLEIVRTGLGLLTEYRDWRDQWPELTAAMVRAGRLADAQRQRELAALIAEWVENAV